MVKVLILFDFVEATTVANAKRKWSAPIHIYRSSEFFLDLPSYGDVKVITDCRRKVVRIIVENINYVSSCHFNADVEARSKSTSSELCSTLCPYPTSQHF